MGDNQNINQTLHGNKSSAHLRSPPVPFEFRGGFCFWAKNCKQNATINLEILFSSLWRHWQQKRLSCFNKGPVTPGERMKNARRAHWKMVCASLFVVIRYSFVERAAPAFLIRDHSLGALSSAHKCTRQKDVDMVVGPVFVTQPIDEKYSATHHRNCHVTT